MKTVINPSYSLALLLLLLFGSMHIDKLYAQEETNKKWGFLVEPYILFPYIQGNVGVGSTITLPVDADPGDIFSNLQFGGMIYLEANTDKWAITSDYVLMMLKQDVTPTNLISSGTVELTQSIWELAGLYRLNSFIEVGIGGRLNYLPVSTEAVRNVLPEGSENLSGSHSKTFYDPIIITRLATAIKGKWLLQFRGDLGGFGVGSDFTWQIQAYAGYKFKKLFQLTAGYRMLGINYDKGDYAERFIFDVNEFGPVVRFGFNF